MNVDLWTGIAVVAMSLAGVLLVVCSARGIAQLAEPDDVEKEREG